MAAIDRIELDSDMLAAAADSRAWPFEEARKIVARYAGRGVSGRGAVRDRLRPLRPAPYRHLRRGRAHDHGAACLPCADRGQGEDPPAVLLRRHGRVAQGARQRPQQGDAAGASRHAADPRAGSVLRRVSVSFGAANNARLRAFLDRFGFDYEFASATDYYTRRPLRRDAAARCSSASTTVMAIMLPSLARGAGADLFAVPADPSRRPASSCRCRSRSATSTPARSSGATPTAASASRRRSPAAMPSCNGSPTGRCAGRRSASTTRCRART